MDVRTNSLDLSPPGEPAALPAGEPARPSVDTTVANPAVASPPRILVVEDQEDVRRMLATALEIEGYDVDDAANAHEGLRRLERRTYHLVLTDYAMPDGTGTWLLQEAKRAGLLSQTAAVIVTAHPDVRGFADVPVINKPLELDGFLDQVRKLVYPARPVAPQPRAVHHKLELVLYISSRSPASMQARHNLERCLADVEPGQVKCVVVDLLESPLAGEADRIAFTPTLVKHHPGPRAWIVGNLNDPSVLTHMLRASGIDGVR
jgi:CheY-like chemotaxis protein